MPVMMSIIIAGEKPLIGNLACKAVTRRNLTA